MNEGSKLEEIVNYVYPLVFGSKVLDVGTGYGTVITTLLADERFEVVTVDPEAWSFDRINEEYRDELDSGRLRLVKARAEILPFREREFDTTLSVCALHHLPDPLLGLEEIERVTSGRTIITDWSPSSSGKHNPHSSSDLEKNMQSIFSYASKNKYSIEDHGDWFLAWKHLKV